MRVIESGAVCGGVAPRTPDPAVPELLEELVTNHDIRCAECGDLVDACEMFVCWPLVSFVAHLSCYVGGRRIGGEA
jgi:hypothetical protein